MAKQSVPETSAIDWTNQHDEHSGIVKALLDTLQMSAYSKCVLEAETVATVTKLMQLSLEQIEEAGKALSRTAMAAEKTSGVKA